MRHKKSTFLPALFLFWFSAEEDDGPEEEERLEAEPSI